MKINRKSVSVFTLILSFQLPFLVNGQVSDTHKELADELATHLNEVRSKDFSQRNVMDSKLRELANRKIPESAEEKKELSRAWELAARIVRKTHGTTPYVAEALMLASELDPENEQLASNALFEAVRQEKIKVRIEEAQRRRDARANQR